MSIPPIPAPPPPAPDTIQDTTSERTGSFRNHLARALSGAAHVAGAVAPAQPAGGAFASGLDGLSRILDSEAAHARGSTGELEEVLSETRSMNARYIELQTRMQMESQAFTAASNILKVRHESAQTALNNIR